MLLSPLGRHVHQRRRSQLRNVTDDRHQLVVLGRIQRHDPRTECGQQPVQLPIGVQARPLRRGQDPPGALEERGRGGLDPLLLGAGHGVSADEV